MEFETIFWHQNSQIFIVRIDCGATWIADLCSQNTFWCTKQRIGTPEATHAKCSCFIFNIEIVQQTWASDTEISLKIRFDSILLSYKIKKKNNSLFQPYWVVFVPKRRRKKKRTETENYLIFREMLRQGEHFINYEFLGRYYVRVVVVAPKSRSKLNRNGCLARLLYAVRCAVLSMYACVCEAWRATGLPYHAHASAVSFRQRVHRNTQLLKTNTNATTRSRWLRVSYYGSYVIITYYLWEQWKCQCADCGCNSNGLFNLSR